MVRKCTGVSMILPGVVIKCRGETSRCSPMAIAQTDRHASLRSDLFLQASHMLLRIKLDANLSDDRKLGLKEVDVVLFIRRQLLEEVL